MNRFAGEMVVLFGMVSGLFQPACDEPPPPSAASTLGSRVELAAGDVRLVTEKSTHRLITGALLEEKATVEVAAGGRALISLNSGMRVFLKEKTTVDIEKGVLTLKTGELWAEIPSSEEPASLKTASVTVSAEDAGIDLANDGKRISVYAARGMALAAGSGGRAEVQSGERAVFEGGGAPKVEPVSFWEDWTGGLADRSLSAGEFGQGGGTLYGMDRNRSGAAPEPLQITAQSVFVTVRNGIAHTQVDQRFFNPSSAPLEGYYWFTVPEGASVDRFALEVNGTLVDGEIVERKQAAQAYEDAVQNAFDPALLEWIDGKSYRARIFPIPAAGERRVVLSYFESLPLADGAYRYVYPMASLGATVQEFSLTVDLGEEGEKFEAKTQEDASVEADKRRISIRRSGFKPKSDFLLELVPKEKKGPLKVMRFSGGDNEADYVMVRLMPEVDWQKLTKVAGDVVVVMDTSAGGDDADRQVRQDAAEAILRALSDDDRFAVVTADLTPKVIYPEQGRASASEQNVSSAMERLSEVSSAGATDLGSMFSSALNLLHGSDQPAVVYVGDGNATVGETTSDALTDRLKRALGESRARLFTIGVGEDANVPLLDRLARLGGGRSFVISDSSQTVQEALRFVGMLKTPTLTNLKLDAGKGLDQMFVSAAGKVSEGDEVILLARTHHALPSKLTITGKLGNSSFEKTYDIDEEKDGRFGFIPILWAGQYLQDLMRSGLDQNRGRIISLGLSYSLMTPFTSFLVLESDAAYMQQGIQRRNRYRFSDLGKRDLETTVAASDALSIPLGLMGCKSEASAPPIEMEQAKESAGSPASQTAAMNAPSPPPIVSAGESGEGRRHKLEEGEMGKRDSVRSGAGMDKKIPESAPMEDQVGGGTGEGTVTLGDLGMIGHSGGMGTGYGKGRAAPAKPRSTSVKMKSKDADDDRSQIADGQSYVEEAKKKDLFVTEFCSDASKRSLAERRMLWARRLAMASDASQYFDIFMTAGKSCELPMWRDRKTLLDLIDSRVHSADEVTLLLSSFQVMPSTERYLRNRILRRAFDPDQLLGDSPGESYWPAFRAGLFAIKSPGEREKKLEEFIKSNPDHVQAREMLVEVLIQQNKTDLAEKEAVKIRRDGTATPKLLEMLCDLQADKKDITSARRTCSELVEFNPNNSSALERLGDMFLRHGWYKEAYRQYTGLVEMIKETPTAMLRLAAAAAGMGKVDEALRIERKVATGDGEDGPNDPRRIAALHSAARLAALLLTAKNGDETEKTAVERNLKRTQVFTEPSTMAFLIWEDFQTGLSITAKSGGIDLSPSESAASPDTGLAVLDLGRDQPADVTFDVKQQNLGQTRAVSYTLLIVTFDGKAFRIEKKSGTATSNPVTV
jgi:hypothetical protein